jgi:hypothetical protein
VQTASERSINSHRNANNRDSFNIGIRHDNFFELCCRHVMTSYFDQILRIV